MIVLTNNDIRRLSQIFPESDFYVPHEEAIVEEVARGITRPQGPHCDSGAFERARFAFVGFFSPVSNAPVRQLQ